ncbi:MAG TPA: gamma-glutamylcyclotransferase family protein [Roseiarcus sp.]|nr:gamma-glutamylcyclotransferase family protein [Roseiarcus sp.]
MPLYFAYGSNMDPAAMARRCPRAAAIAPARLMRHRLALTREGWLTAIHDPRAAVHGILWDLRLSDVPPLDRYEGVANGLYHKAIQAVTTRGGPKRALIYFGANPGPGVPSPGYIEGIVEAARQWGLPEAALGALQSFLPRSSAADAAPLSSPPRQVRPRFATPFDRI